MSNDFLLSKCRSVFSQSTQFHEESLRESERERKETKKMKLKQPKIDKLMFKEF